MIQLSDKFQINLWHAEYYGIDFSGTYQKADKPTLKIIIFWNS